jgi:O-antigen/teichoic acid export membrane protein
MIVVVTVVARRLKLGEFGVYGLFVSIAGYLLVVQLSIEGAAVRAIASADGPEGRERVFSTALVLYAAGGLVAGLLIAALGLLLAGLVGIPAALRPSARVGILILAVLTVVGWPAKVFQDLLRATQLFGLAALGEMLAYGVVSLGVVALVLSGASLSLIIGIGGALPATIGMSCMAMAYAFRVPIPYRHAAVDRSTATELLGVSRYLLVVGIANLVIYETDRLVLAAFKGISAVGLYEGAIRPRNMMMQLQGTLALSVAPVASRLRADEDAWRNRQLMVRGSRYVLGVVAAVATTLVVLATPVLEVWLGHRYRFASTALSILAGYWLIAGASAVPASMLVAAGRVRFLATFAVLCAVANLALVLSLTSILGLNGVAIGVAAPTALLTPWLISTALNEFGVRLSDLARQAWVPAYATSAGLAVGLLVVRSHVGLHSLWLVALTAVCGLGSVFAIYWFVWFDRSERDLVKSLIRHRIVTMPAYAGVQAL